MKPTRARQLAGIRLRIRNSDDEAEIARLERTYACIFRKVHIHKRKQRYGWRPLAWSVERKYPRTGHLAMFCGPEEFQKIRMKADRYAQGSISAWIRYAALNHIPNRWVVRRTR